MNAREAEKRMVRGLLVEVLRQADGHDCTAEGVTSKFDKAILVGEGIPAIFQPTPDCPALELRKKWPNTLKEYLYAVPADLPESTWVTFGGNFIYTSDSRFPGRYPIPVHDRIEGGQR